MRGTIFIQIAAYRDPQLIPTIESILENASNPKRLRFGICRQYHPQDGFDSLEKYVRDSRFSIIDFDITKEASPGVCWARNQVQTLYNKEQYTLQIDSHMRFVPNWDRMCVSMLRELQKKGNDKPLLTGYVPSFDPDNDPGGRASGPWEMVFDRFTPEGVVFFLPSEIPNWKKRESPVPARFYSAHFAFTLGKFSEEVKHDPKYYFHGEEISIAVRAYTHGYDLFHPHKIICYHEYTRKGRTKVWDDDPVWVARNIACHLRNRVLLGMQDDDTVEIESEYGFGRVRSLQDYEAYAGIRFRDRAVQQYTLDNGYPPNPKLSGKEYNDSFLRIFKHCIDLSFTQVPLEDYDFWAVAFHDNQDNTLFRKDAFPEEIERMREDTDGYIKLWREFYVEDKKPDYWVVWPYSNSKGWQERITGKL